ncbi:MAG: sialidase family protein, partial [Thermoanaerobaculia bacterium]
MAGTEWPGGDPFLQRQNEPSIAVSTRNPLHLLAGANDYRTVDIPGLENIKVIGDAWLGIFRSYDGGNTWTSTLLPGYPQDTSQAGMVSPLKGYPAGADPVMRAGANGLFYLAGITLSRDENPLGAFFVARYLDHNDKESSHLVTEEAHSIRYVDTKIIQKGTSGQFNDKPWLAVDIPRAGAAPCTVDGQTIDGGNVYAAWTVLVGGDENIRSRLMATRSTDCGATWQKPIYLSETHAISQGASIAIDPRNGNVYVVWRRIRNDKGETDALLFAKSTDFGKTFSQAQLIREITPFEQGTHELAFRTTMFPSMAVDGDGKIHIVWSERNAEWRGRIALITSTDGATWSQPVFVANEGLGHQFMPTINFAHGKLTLAWYDQTEDHTRGIYDPILDGDKHTGQYTELRQPMGHLAQGKSQEVFRNFIIEYGETQPPLRRHTLDVYVAQADPSLMTTPQFQSHRASRYYFGSRPYPNEDT